jgi:hypothetical protein
MRLAYADQSWIFSIDIRFRSESRVTSTAPRLRKVRFFDDALQFVHGFAIDRRRRAQGRENPRRTAKRGFAILQRRNQHLYLLATGEWERLCEFDGLASDYASQHHGNGPPMRHSMAAKGQRRQRNLAPARRLSRMVL